MVEIILYNYNGEKNTVNKKLQRVFNLKGTLKDYFNYLNPSIKVRVKDIKNCNYCYISSFKRYYFIEDVVVRTDGSFELLLNVDVLKSYEDVIMQSTGTVTQSTNSNKYLSDRVNVYDVKPKFEKIEFKNKGLFNEKGSIIMITIKGNNIKEE